MGDGTLNLAPGVLEAWLNWARAEADQIDPVLSGLTKQRRWRFASPHEPQDKTLDYLWLNTVGDAESPSAVDTSRS